jgi:hypothetical protein
MKVKIVINTFVQTNDDILEPEGYEERAEIFDGELNILPDKTYLTKISIIAEGEAHPICDIPFSLNNGWWEWHPGRPESQEYKPPSYYDIEPQLKGQVERNV